MFATDIPTKFPVKWANSAPIGTGVRAIPTTASSQPGAASLDTGFPPLNMVPVAAGGIPPFGQDMNGVLQQVTAWLRFMAAGGPVAYDATYATAIGGYPARALILSNSGHAWFESLVDNNANDPNAGGANWRVASSVWSAGVWTAGGSANAQLITFTPAATSQAQLNGISFTFKSIGTNAAAVTLNVNTLGALPLLASNGAQLSGGALVSGGIYQAVFDTSGSVFRLLTGVAVFTDSSATGAAIVGAGANGANLALIGNGGTTPSKFIRAANGLLQFVNNAYSGVIASFTDAGALTTTAGITATTGNIAATAGRLRAGLGATGSGDLAAASILSDFPFSLAGTAPVGFGYTKLPNGFIVQWGVGTVPPGATNVIITFPLAFQIEPLSLMVNEGAPSSWLIAGRTTVYAASTINTAQAQIIGLIWNNVTAVWEASAPASAGISFRYIVLGH